MREKQRRLGTGLMSRSASAREMMVCIWPRKKRTRFGFTAPSASSTSASADLSCTRRMTHGKCLVREQGLCMLGALQGNEETLTCVLLILLLGNHREYVQLLSALHIRSSQRFLPRLSRMGRDEKSSSQSSDVGVLVDGASAAVSGAGPAGLADVPASASTVSALHNTCSCLLLLGRKLVARRFLPRNLLHGSKTGQALLCFRQCRSTPDPCAGAVLALGCIAATLWLMYNYFNFNLVIVLTEQLAAIITRR